MEQELITIPPQTALQVFTTEGAIEPFLAKVRAFTEGFVPDTSTKKGRAEIASRAYRVSQTKCHLESCGKTLADQQKDIPKKIDATRRLFREELDRIRDTIRKPLDEWEAVEAARIAAHKASMASIEGASALCASAAEIRASIAELEAFVIGPACEEFEAQYGRLKDDALRTLRMKLGERERYEAEQAELARLRVEAEARATHERDERIRAEAAEAERTKAAREAEAERQRVAQAAAAERARVEAEATAKQEAASRRERELQRAAEAERRRADEAERLAADTERRLKVEAEAKAHREAQEAAAREANNRRRARINNEVVAALVKGGIDEAASRAAVILIAQRAVPHVSITY